MGAPKDTIYPDKLKIRDTGIHEDSGRRIHTTAGSGYPKKEYIRSDLFTALQAENKRLREEKEDAVSLLDAWFDRRKLAHEQIDAAVLDAARGYLRTSRSGGMEARDSDMIEGVVSDMARLSLFADLFARAALKGTDQ
ncbi:hypothetical protein [Roseovarius amoyensis]|uniref:hypothetical protein n=1 Tax=Roseovarius amoyensis TaxID=2211448 RepID=UPI000DBE05F0|nr:hypothetical protein [Roseovarius amoyensis]